MTHLFEFNQLDKLANVGFERIFNELRTAQQWCNYPPNNLIQVEDNKYRIEIAVAGFDRSDIVVNKSKDTLTVKSKNGESLDKLDAPVGTYIHRGLAKRGFSLKYNLASFIEVYSVKLENGVLIIDLVRELPEAEKERIYEIL